MVPGKLAFSILSVLVITCCLAACSRQESPENVATTGTAEIIDGAGIVESLVKAAMAVAETAFRESAQKTESEVTTITDQAGFSNSDWKAYTELTSDQKMYIGKSLYKHAKEAAANLDKFTFKLWATPLEVTDLFGNKFLANARINPENDHQIDLYFEWARNASLKQLAMVIIHEELHPYTKLHDFTPIEEFSEAEAAGRDAINHMAKVAYAQYARLGEAPVCEVLFSGGPPKTRLDLNGVALLPDPAVRFSINVNAGLDLLDVRAWGKEVYSFPKPEFTTFSAYASRHWGIYIYAVVRAKENGLVGTCDLKVYNEVETVPTHTVSITGTQPFYLTTKRTPYCSHRFEDANGAFRGYACVNNSALYASYLHQCNYSDTNWWALQKEAGIANCSPYAVVSTIPGWTRERWLNIISSRYQLSFLRPPRPDEKNFFWEILAGFGDSGANAWVQEYAQTNAAFLTHLEFPPDLAPSFIFPDYRNQVPSMPEAAARRLLVIEESYRFYLGREVTSSERQSWLTKAANEGRGARTLRVLIQQLPEAHQFIAGKSYRYSDEGHLVYDGEHSEAVANILSEDPTVRELAAEWTITHKQNLVEVIFYAFDKSIQNNLQERALDSLDKILRRAFLYGNSVDVVSRIGYANPKFHELTEQALTRVGLRSYQRQALKEAYYPE